MALTDVEISEIKTTWRIPMANCADSGQAILLRFFEKYPSNLEKFQSFKDIPLEELKNSARFRAHAGRIMKIFDEAISSLGTEYSESALADIWARIAESHFQRSISKESFDQLKEAIVDVLSAACALSESQLEAWSKLLDHCYGIIFHTLDKLTN